MALHPTLPTMLLTLLILSGCGSSDNNVTADPDNGSTTGNDTGNDGGSTGGDTGGGTEGGETGGVADQVNSPYPANIDDPSTRTQSVARTLNGVSLSDNLFGGREGSLPVADADGDGQSDYVFLSPAALVSDCTAGVLIASGTLPSPTLVTADLESSLRITYGTGDTCRDVSSISAIGDVNGDELMDIAVFVSHSQGFGAGTGAVVFGSLTEGLVNVLTLDGQNGFVLDDIQTEGFNVGLSSLGDLNADGFDDILLKNSSGPVTQAWYVIEGRAGFPDSRSSGDITTGEILLSLRPQAYVSAAGDVNGDGADDVIVSNRVDVGPQVIYGQSGLANATIAGAAELVRDCTAGTYCGATALGDIDADGFDDLAVTHSLGSSACGYGGRSAVFYGSSNGTITLDTLDDQSNPAITRLVEGVASPCIAGGSYGFIGDLDGDGAAEFGISGASTNGIVFGRQSTRPSIVWLDDLDGTVGFRLKDYPRTGPLDINGDGFDDVVFEDNSAFAGRIRSLDANGPTFQVIERGPAFVSAHWDASTLPEASGFRLEYAERLIAELDAGTLEQVFDPLDGEENDIVLSVVDSSGTVLAQSVRRVPAFEQRETLSSIIYGARLVQISFAGDGNIQRYGRYLVWRNGEPLARAPDGAYDYVDDTVEPGNTYEYFVTPDYLPQGSLDATGTDYGPVLRRRSETIVVITPAG